MSNKRKYDLTTGSKTGIFATSFNVAMGCRNNWRNSETLKETLAETLLKLLLKILLKLLLKLFWNSCLNSKGKLHQNASLKLVIDILVNLCLIEVIIPALVYKVYSRRCIIRFFKKVYSVVLNWRCIEYEWLLRTSSFFYRKKIVWCTDALEKIITIAPLKSPE